MNAIEKTIEWTTGSGKKACVRIALATSKIVNADGDQCEVPCCELHIAAEVAGLGIMAYGITRKAVVVAGVSYPATAGRLVIPAAQLANIDAVLAEVHARPEWKARESAKAAADKANAEYEERREFMRTQMGY